MLFRSLCAQESDTPLLCGQQAREDLDALLLVLNPAPLASDPWRSTSDRRVGTVLAKAAWPALATGPVPSGPPPRGAAAVLGPEEAQEEAGQLGRWEPRPAPDSGTPTTGSVPGSTGQLPSSLHSSGPASG